MHLRRKINSECGCVKKCSFSRISKEFHRNSYHPSPSKSIILLVRTALPKGVLWSLKSSHTLRFFFPLMDWIKGSYDHTIYLKAFDVWITQIVLEIEWMDFYYLSKFAHQVSQYDTKINPSISNLAHFLAGIVNTVGLHLNNNSLLFKFYGR